jgi:uncharacterized glyoxalase superfamily protein PhnB
MSTEQTFVSGPTNRSCPSPTVIPVLYYPDVHAAAAWLCTAFGFTERLRIFDHRIQLNVGEGGAIVVADGPGSSPGDGTVSVSIMIRVQNADEHLAMATRGGAIVLTPIATHPFGERQYTVKDFAGHKWTFSQTVENIDPAAWGGELVNG